MSESFCDLTVNGDFKATENPLKYFYSLNLKINI